MFLRMSGREAGIGAKAEIGTAALVEGRKPIKRGGGEDRSRAQKGRACGKELL